MREFFASYARDDSEDILENFIVHLAEAVRAEAGGKLEDVYFFDKTTIKTGQDWRDVLGEALARCKVCVCICSTSFFNSPYCGREVQVFVTRAGQWQPAAPVPEDPSFVIPVMWVAKPRGGIPAAFNQLNRYHGAFPEMYIKLGLRQTIELGNTGPGTPYKQVINALKDLIVAALSAAPPLPPLQNVDFDAVANFFQPDTGGKAYGVAGLVVSYGAGEWTPYPNELPMPGFLESTVSKMGMPYRALKCDDTLDTQLEQAERNREAVIALVNPLAIHNLQAHLAVLNARRSSNLALLVPWNDSPLPEPVRTALGEGLTAALPSYAGTAGGLHDLGGVNTPTLLANKVTAAVAQIVAGTFRKDPPQRSAQNEMLRQEAENAGIPVAGLVTLSGPQGQ